MKKINFLIISVLFATIVFMDSCKKDGETIELVPPAISINQITEKTIYPGDNITCEVTISATNGDLETLKIDAYGIIGSYLIMDTEPANAWDKDKLQFVQGTKSAKITYQIQPLYDLAEGENYEIKFIVTDTEGQTNSAAIEFTIGTLPSPTISVNQTSTEAITPGSTITYEITAGTSNGDLVTLTVLGTGAIQPDSGSAVISTTPDNKWDADKNKFVIGTSSVKVVYEIKIGGNLYAGDTFDVKFNITDEKGKFNSVIKTIAVN